MEIAYAFLAEAAQLTADQRMNILGADIREVRGPFPLVVPSASLILKIISPPQELNERSRLLIELYGPTGAPMEGYRMEQEFGPVGQPPEGGPFEAAFTFVLQFAGLQLPTPGLYRFRITLNDRVMRDVLLRAAEAPPIAAGA